MRKMASTGVGTLAVLIGAAVAAAGQCEPRWLPTADMPGAEFFVYAFTTWDPDGPGPKPEMLVLGGVIYNVGGVLSTAVAAWDGARWYAIANELPDGWHDQLGCLAICNGELFAAPSWISSDQSVARWNGSAWETIGPGVYVRGLTAFNGELYACTDTGLLRWDGATWQPLSDTPASALAVYNGEIVVADSSGVKRWDGTAWQPLGGAFVGSVSTMTVYDGLLIAAGNFSNAGGTPAMNIAAWDDFEWQPLGTGTDGPIFDLAVYGSNLVAGGPFTNAGGNPALRIARWNGSDWQALGSGVGGANCQLRCLDAMIGYRGRLVVGGTFWEAGGRMMYSLAAWDELDWRPLTKCLNDDVLCLTVFDDELVAGGRLTLANDEIVNHIARWDGTHWRAYGGGVDGRVLAVTAHGGELIAGGVFTMADGQPASHVARWDGAAWHAMGAGMNDRVNALTVFDGDVIAGGNFTMAGDQPANYIARWDGAAWQPIGTGMDGYVYAIATYNSDLIAGGDFNTAGGAPAHKIARWDGSQWYPLDTGMDAAVWALGVFAGELIAGGDFLTAGGATCNRVAAWNGSQWRALGTGMDNRVRVLSVFDDDLIAGGSFGLANGAPAAHIARWDGAWHPLGLGLEADAGIYASGLAVYHDQLLVGGNFWTAGDLASGCWARWGTAPTIAQSPASQQTCPGHPVVFQVVAAGDGTLSYQWRRDGVDLANGGNVSGVTTGTLTIDPAGDADVGTYSVVVTDTCGTLESLPARLDIGTPPAIVAQSPPATLTVGETIQFSITPVGIAPLTYQWFRDGAPLSDGEHIAGATSATLTVSGVTCAESGVYQAVVANGCGSATSDSAALTVLPRIDQNPTPVVLCEGEAAVFFVAASGSGTLHYQWRHDGLNLTDGGNISGATTDTLQIDPAGATDDGVYDVIVAHDCAALASQTAALTVHLAATIVEPPAPQNGTYGETVQFSAIAGGTPPLDYIWLKDGVPLTDDGHFSGVTTPTLTIATVGCIDAGAYQFGVGNACGVAFSDPVALNVTDPVLTLQPVSQIGLVGDSVQWDALAVGSDPLAFQWYKDGVALTEGEHFYGTNTPSLVIAAVQPGDGGEYVLVVSNPCGTLPSTPATLTVWFPGDLNCDGVRNFDDINAFVDAISDPAFYQQQYPGCNIMNADCNGDGAVNFDDINPFVELLSR